MGYEGGEKGHTIPGAEGKDISGACPCLVRHRCCMCACSSAYFSAYASAFTEHLAGVRHCVQRGGYRDDQDSHSHACCHGECWGLGRKEMLTGPASCPFSPGRVGCLSSRETEDQGTLETIFQPLHFTDEETSLYSL